MTTIVTRAGKGSALTWTEMDSNFSNLNSGKVEISSPSFTGNLSADLSNTTLTSRIYIVTSTAGGNSSVGTTPNGAGTTAEFRALGSSTPTNAAYAAVQINATNADFISSAAGSGTPLPLRLLCNGNTGLTVSTTGAVTVSTPAAGDNSTTVANTAFVTANRNPIPVLQHTATTASANNHYVCDTSFTLTLPLSPSNGDVVRVTNSNSGSTITVARNGNLINQAAANDTVGTTVTTKTYIYANVSGSGSDSWYTI